MSAVSGRSARQRVRAFGEAHRSTTIIVVWAIAATLLPLLATVPPLSLFQPSQNVWVDGFTNAGIFMLLALGLNIVVGLAGLLDLGYAAFFAIGAYTYAFAASPFTNIDVPFWPMLL